MIKKGKMEKIDDFIYDIAKDVTNIVWNAYMQNPFLKYYLILKPTNGRHKKLLAIEDNESIPENAELAWNEHTPRNITKPQMVKWIIEKMRRMPIIPENF